MHSPDPLLCFGESLTNSVCPAGVEALSFPTELFQDALLGFACPGMGKAQLSSPHHLPGPYLGRLHFVAAAAAPSREVRQHFAFLPMETRLHLAPPLLQHDGGWGEQGIRARLQHRAQSTSSAHLWVTSGDRAPLSSRAHTEEPWTRSCSSPARPHLSQLLHLSPEHPVVSHYPRCKAQCPCSQGQPSCSMTSFRFHFWGDCVPPLCSVGLL